MRKIDYIAVHCTATSQLVTVDDLLRGFKRKGWKRPGYHYVIKPTGGIFQMLSDDQVSNGVKGYNSKLINVAYIGGIDATGKAIDNRTEEQKATLIRLLRLLKKKFPNAKIQGHRDFSPDLNHDGKIEPNEWVKMCPCFDAKTEYQDI